VLFAAGRARGGDVDKLLQVLLNFGEG
jgi:hypothetical protein